MLDLCKKNKTKQKTIDNILTYCDHEQWPWSEGEGFLEEPRRIYAALSGFKLIYKHLLS